MQFNFCKAVKWPKYRISSDPPADPSWPIHVKHVKHCDIQKILHDMNIEERAGLTTALASFTAATLCKVKVSGPSEVHLTKPQVEYLIKVGLFRQSQSDTKPGPKMKIFLVPECEKRRWRLIIHTVDINDHFQTYECDVVFEELTGMINNHLLENSFVYQNDCSSYYHQFALDSIDAGSSRFYTFYVEGIGWLELVTIPTGQRQCVEVAQRVSQFLNRKLKESIGVRVPSPTLHLVAAYVDNFKGASETFLGAKHAFDTLHRIAGNYNITFNEEKATTENISREFEHRGVAFARQRANIGPKTSRKIADLRRRLEDISGWSILEVEQAFGLLIYCSTVLDIKLWQYYAVFKYIRRRMRQLAMHELGQHDQARVWPCTFPGWVEWTNRVETHRGRQAQREVSPDYVLITDASCLGFGGILFNNITLQTSSYGATWSEEAVDSTQHINVLEMKALTLVAGKLLPAQASVAIIVDNTTVMYAVRNQRTSNWHINTGLAELAQYRITSIRYIRSAENPADSLSRGRATSTYDKQLLVSAVQATATRNGEQEGVDWKDKV